MRVYVRKPRPNAVPVVTASRGRPCGHTHHVGTCSACQAAQLARWAAQDREVRSC